MNVKAVFALQVQRLEQPLTDAELRATGDTSEKVRWGQARWGLRFFEKIAKKYVDSFQTHQQVTKNLQFHYQMHRKAVQFVFVL